MSINKKFNNKHPKLHIPQKQNAQCYKSPKTQHRNNKTKIKKQSH